MKNPFSTLFGKNTKVMELKSAASQGRRLTPELKRSTKIRAEAELDALRVAVQAAQHIETPQRIKLYAIYERVLQDSHLQAQIRTAKLSVLKSDFDLLKNGKPDEKAKLFFTQSWFDSFVEYALDTEFWGHSLIEFSVLNEKKEFDDVLLIPREHVKPELGLVVVEPADDKGIAYREVLTELALIEVGNSLDLGLLQTAAKEVIVKNYARTDWSQASEKYGMPLLKIKTNSEDSKEIDELQQMATNFASNGYIILNAQDDAEITQIQNTDFYKIYLENIAHCNENISKLINGQTGTADEKSFVGSAEVHERLLNDYTFSRLRKVQHVINNKLIPFLVSWGYPLSDYSFQYTDLLQKKIEATNADKLSDLFS